MTNNDDTKRHFNGMATGYSEEIPCHIKDHLLNKWWSIVSDYVGPGAEVVDVGCGEGRNVAYMWEKGLRVTGVDFSDGLIHVGRHTYSEIRDRIFVASALELPFADESFDVATLTGVLHHIHSRHDQLLAIAESLRVVRKNGCVIIRECNLINPLFRIFWNYIFPLTSRIDRFGGEYWVPLKLFNREFGQRLEAVHFFTFLPNFTPAVLLPLATGIESRLEKGMFRKLAAHYVAVIRKTG